MRTRIIRTFLILCLPALNLAAAQNPVITGRITDDNGGAIRGAKATLTDPSGREVTSSVSGGDGGFRLSAPAGNYEMTVEAGGFASLRRTVTMIEGEQTIDLTLEPGKLSESMTITPVRAEVRLVDAPASVSVLDSRDVDHAAAQTMDDLLRQVPGFSIFRRSSSLVANPTTQGVSLRGTGASGASRTLVLSDGVPLNDAFGGWVYWDRIPRTSVDRIELVRGGSSDLYGSDALSGVINVISRPVTARVVDFEASYGSRDTADLTFYIGDRWKGFGINLTGEFLQTDGYFLVAQRDRGAADAEASSRHRALGLRLGYDWRGENQFFLRGSLFDENRNNGTLLQRNDTATESLVAGARLRTADGSNWNFAVFANQQRFHQNFTAISIDRNTETLSRNQFVPSRDAGFSFNWSRPSLERHLLVAGVDLRGVRGTSDEEGFFGGRMTTFLSSGGRQRRAGFFAQDLIRISSRWQLAVSARYDNWRDSSAASVLKTLATGAVQPTFFAPRSKDAFSPRLALTWRPLESLSFRAAGYRAFRAPTLNELYRGFRVGNVQTLANELLEAERLTGGEAGADWTGSNIFTARVSGYWTETVNPVTNFTLSVTPSLITRQRRNLGRTRSRGIEAETEIRPSRYWRVTAGYLFSDATVKRAPQDASLVGLWLPQIPRHQFTLQTVYSHPDQLTAAMQFRASGRQFDDDQNQLPLGSFAVVDAMVSRRIIGSLDLFLAVQNLFDEQYAVGRTPVETLGMPRMIRGGIRIRFEK